MGTLSKLFNKKYYLVYRPKSTVSNFESINKIKHVKHVCLTSTCMQVILTESAFNLATYTTTVDISINMPAFT